MRSIKNEALSWEILFGENPLLHVLSEYTEHDYQERYYQGLGHMT
jgi:hypothetical protein